MTGKDILDRAYEMVADTVQPRRNKLGLMVSVLNDGIRDLMARRPYLRLNDDGTHKAAFTDLTAENLGESDLPLDESTREGLAHYVAYRVFEIDSEDEANLRQSQQHRQQYIFMT